jgi:spermidine/putrescine ABC transporter ATP-binding subunit
MAPPRNSDKTIASQQQVFVGLNVSNVRLHRISKRYDAVDAVQALDLEIEQGEFLTLLGPSGCGKTTTLRIIAGFLDPTAGRVFIGGEDVTELPPQKRAIGMVFQDYALFPHLTIGENIAFGLVERGSPRAKIEPRVRELLELIRLPNVALRYPSELSGGQQQRVALARAIAYPPRVLLMDEPLGALDLKMRETMQLELRHIQQKLKITTIYVTHDQNEAMTMSDRIAVMNAGQIEQLDTPKKIYTAPRTKFVANFVGKVNFLPGTVSEHFAAVSAVETRAGKVFCSAYRAISPGTKVTLALRPEHLQLLTADAQAVGMNVMKGTIESESFTGNLLHVGVRLADGYSLLVETKPCLESWKVADEVRVGWRTSDAVLISEG